MIQYPDLAPAFVGIVRRYGQPSILCYDLDLVLAGYVKDGMTMEEAEEFFDFNTIGAWVGDTTPCFIQRMSYDEAMEVADEMGEDE